MTTGERQGGWIWYYDYSEWTSGADSFLAGGRMVKWEPAGQNPPFIGAGCVPGLLEVNREIADAVLKKEKRKDREKKKKKRNPRSALDFV